MSNSNGLPSGSDSSAPYIASKDMAVYLSVVLLSLIRKHLFYKACVCFRQMIPTLIPK